MSQLINQKKKKKLFQSPLKDDEDVDSLISNQDSIESNDKGKQKELLRNKLLSYKKQKLELETPKKVIIKLETLLQINVASAKNDDDYSESEPINSMFSKKIEEKDDFDDINNDDNNVDDIQNNETVKKSNTRKIKKVSNNTCKRDNKNIIGEGNISVLHAFIRDEQFKKIKIVAPEHLTLDSVLMKACFRRLEYNEIRDGNKIAYGNALRSEIQNTMNSRRGYVKRKIGVKMKGKKKMLFCLDFYFTLN
jgi:hypothetical protein